MKKLLLSLAALAIVAGCKNPADDFDLKLDSDFMEYTMMVEFVDAGAPGEEIEKLEIEIIGKDASAILESSGKKEFKVTNGRIVLAVNPAYKPEGDKALEFAIRAKAPGYLPINMPAHFREEEREQILTLNMVNLSKTPEGVANSTGSEALNNGQLDVAKEVSVVPSGSKKTGAKVMLSPGTKFYDADGNQLSGNQLEVSLTHFDAEGDASVNSFPGGFMPETVIGPSGSEEEVFFNTAGFASINMNVGGETVKEFSQPVEVNMSVDPTVPNMNTGGSIKAGDVIPVWSYDVETGAWQYEDDGIVEDNNGQLEVNFSTTHLSWYNLDFYGPRCWGNRVNGKVNISIGGGDANGAMEYFMCDVVFASNNQPVSYFSSKTQLLHDGKQISFFNAPNALCKFRVYDGSSWYRKGNLIAESEPFNICSESVNVTIPSSAFPETAILDVEATCESNPGFTMRPNFYLYYKRPGSWYYSYLTYVRQGSARSSRLNIGQSYEFRVYYGGRYYDFTEEVQKENVFHVELDASTCNNLF